MSEKTFRLLLCIAAYLFVIIYGYTEYQDYVFRNKNKKPELNWIRF